MSEPFQLKAPLGNYVQLYFKTKDHIAEIEAEYKAKVKPYNDAIKRLEGVFTEHLASVKQESAVTDQGTIHWEVRYTSPVQDKAEFMKFVIDNKEFDLLERRASSVAVRDWSIKHGKLPPGVKLNPSRTVVVNRPSTEMKQKATTNAALEVIIQGATNERPDVSAAADTADTAATPAVSADVGVSTAADAAAVPTA